MSYKRYQEDCPGCRPVALDLQTGKVLSEDHPMMKALTKVWEAEGPLVRAAFHRVTCLSSKSPLDLALAQGYMQRAQAEASKV